MIVWQTDDGRFWVRKITETRFFLSGVGYGVIRTFKTFEQAYDYWREEFAPQDTPSPP